MPAASIIAISSQKALTASERSIFAAMTFPPQ
jgi:hypothetical protein